MRYKLTLCLLFFALGGAHARAPFVAYAQTPTREQERPKIKEPGPSLKRTNPDAEQKAGVPVGGEKEKQPGTDDEEVLRVDTSLVVCDVLVLDGKGFAVRGLNREDFIVTEDGRAQEIGTFALGDNANVPRSIVLIIDYSGSQRPYIKNSVEAAKTLVDQLNPRDRMAIVTDDVEVLADFTTDRAALKSKLDALKKKAAPGNSFERPRYGRSRQYTALMATLNELFDAEDTRPIIIFQTDGDEMPGLRDPSAPRPRPSPPPGISPERLKEMEKAWEKAWEANRPRFSLADVFRTAERSRVTIYSVIPGVRLIGLAPDEKEGKIKTLREQFYEAWPSLPGKQRDETFTRMVEDTPDMQLALIGLSKLTGGWTDFLEEPSQAAGIYARILSDINRRYVIGFYPSNKERDGKRRGVKIEVRGRPDYTVWGRKSYYAPGPDSRK